MPRSLVPRTLRSPGIVKCGRGRWPGLRHVIVGRDPKPDNVSRRLAVLVDRARELADDLDELQRETVRRKEARSA